MKRARRTWALGAVVAVLSTVVALDIAPVGAARPAATHPYRFVDPGTLGGPQSYIDLPGIPFRNGTMTGTADTSTPDEDFPNFNPFIIGFADPVLGHAFAWRDGKITDLGALPGGNSSAVFQVNSSGVGAGLSGVNAIDPNTGWPAMHAVLFKNGAVVDLGTLPGGFEALALGINDRGLVTGFGSNGVEDPHSFFDWGTQVRTWVWDGSGGLKDIGTLGGADTINTNVNSRGQVSGNSYVDNGSETTLPTIHPFIWENGRMRDLGSLGGTFSVTNWMNESGQATGFATLPGDETGDAFLWDGKRLRDLGTLGGPFSFANYLNDAGHVVGVAAVTEFTAHAFMWADGRMRDLPPIDGFPCSNAFAINNRDDVVGVSDNCQGGDVHPTLWHRGVPYDLSTLIEPPAFTLDEPEFISDRGEIVGHGFTPDGATRLFLLLPNPGGLDSLGTAPPRALSRSVTAAVTPVPVMRRVCAISRSPLVAHVFHC